MGLIEIVVTTAVVVGFFSAVSRPIGWDTASQLLTCSLLGALLWLADSRLENDTGDAPDYVTRSSATG